ncbi:MAG TPA: asparagine synthase-related protein [Geminicoccaceae bacterium]|nr:asparagine synthase-related protein [Geminicoccaceae bacterium]
MTAEAAGGLRCRLFAGRITNRGELEAALQAEGCGAGDGSDGDLLGAVLDAWGPPGLDRVEGGFAYAAGRAGGGTILARDPLALRPLYWTASGDRIEAASRIEPLLAHAGRMPDERAALEWLLYRYVMPPATGFAGVRALPQGCALELPPGATAGQPVPFADGAALAEPARYRELDRAGEAAVLDELERRLLLGVERACAGRARVGVLLSGGIDSALLAAMARRFTEVTAFTVAMAGGPGLDESEAARATAAALGVPIEVLPVSPTEYARSVAAATREAEAPLHHVTNVGFNVALGPLLARAAAMGFDRVLAGDYAGTVLGAPTGPASLRWLLPIGSVLRRAPADVAPALGKLGLAAAGLPVTVMEFAQSVPIGLRLADGGRRARILAAAEELSGFVPGGLARRMRAARIANLAVWFPRYNDRTARLGDTHGAEIVTPFVDRQLLTFVLYLPLRYLVRREGWLAARPTDKWALRQVARRQLGPIRLYRRGAPWDTAQRVFVAPLADELLTSDGFCVGLFGLGAEDLERELPVWRRDVNALAKLVHLEVWGRVWFMGQCPDELGQRLAAAAGPNPGA